MTGLATISTGLPGMVRTAAQRLAAAQDSAEILEARDMASAAYDAAKSAGRIARAKKAHDEIIGVVYRAQADALEIESAAKRRLADEYDAAQERGEVGREGKPVTVPDSNGFIPATTAEIGLTRKQIHEARQIRDVEQADPGVIRRTLDTLIDRGEEPTKAAVNREIVNRTSFTGNNEWYTPQEHIEAARAVLGTIDLDPASSAFANRTVGAAQFFTEDDDGLSREWNGHVWLNPPYAQPAIFDFMEKAVAEWQSGRVTEMIVLTHNYTDTRWFQMAANAATAICFTRGRIRFESPTGEKAAPTQGQAFFYFGTRLEVFLQHFREIGFVVEVHQ
jgi:phage N-6-adenine-methyltransferase